jgi:two-component system sensor histidine kinase KdpD
MQRRFDPTNLTMIYLLGVVVSAIAFGRGPAVLAAVLGVAVFDFCSSRRGSTSACPIRNTWSRSP